DATFDLLYMVMQFINGVSLQDLCDTELKGPVPEETAVPIIRQTLDALGFAQRAGIVHRDIKPDNIIIERDTHRPWVTDFGLARFEQQASTLTAQGQVMGTPHFMSPEQCEGKVVDGRADLYAAGCVFYYMLTHEYAFDGATTTAVIIAQLRKQPKPLHELVPTISPWLERLVLKLLSKKADQRYQTAEEAIADLDAGWAGRGATGAGGGGGSAAGSGAGYHVAHLAHDEGYAEALPAVAMADDDGLGAVAEQVAYASADDVQMPGSGDAYAAGGQRNASSSGRRPRRNADGTSARRAAVARRDPRSSSGTGTDRVAPPGAGGSGGASDSGDENQRFDRRNAIAAPVGSVAARRRGGTDRYPDGGASGDTIRRGPDMHVVIFVIIGVIVAVGVAALILFSNR
ncbi:MAG: serine/threonine-protein kinase, partial [Planctomycetota bacterium]